MPADEAIHGTDEDEFRVRTGPRHAAPRKPLFTRFHVPAGKAVALAAMPTAVLMGMGFTPTLARADDHASSKTMTAEEYQACVEAVDGKGASASPSPSSSSSSSPSSSSSASASASTDTTEPTPAATASSGTTSSSDSGSDDKAGSTPTPSATSASKSAQSSSGQQATATPSASASSGGGDVLGAIGNAITGILTGGSDSTASATATPTATASASASASATTGSTGTSGTSDTVKDTTDKVTDTVKNTVKDTTDTASKAAEVTTKAVTDAATSSPSPSASSSVDPANCPAATDETGGVDNAIALPDDPWYLNASSLLLKGADYQGIVKVRTAGGTVKKVLKYVISDGTEIGDLHQTVNDKLTGKTYHVQAASGSKSTITDGKTIMYTESISGNLLGLLPVTFTPDNPRR